MCIPLQLQNEWIRELHVSTGHVGKERFWQIIGDRHEWADRIKALEFSKLVMDQCDTCQACVRPRNKFGPIVMSPIPPYLMANVAIDVFNMPTVKVEGKTFDCMVVCVDRLSGWIVAIPELKNGLTGVKVAKAMLRSQWRPFGIPSRITSDQGSQFVNQWWKTMCAMLGVNHVYTQPYHHQANGRAEMAGQQVMEVARKLHADSVINWVEALPRVIDKIHDTPGESGLTPYEIVFGRERYMANVPYKPPRDCEDALEFFKRMSELDEKVARILNTKHKREAQGINRGRKDQKPLEVGRAVWYRRQEGSGSKLDTRWVGPCVIVAREGEYSYKIKTGQNVTMKAHRNYLKEYLEDSYNETPKPMFFHQRTVANPHVRDKQFKVTRILGHVVDDDGNYLFNTQKLGVDVSAAEWLPSSEFLGQAGQKMVEYCLRNGLADKVGFLTNTPR